MLEAKETNSSTEPSMAKPGFCKVFFAPWLGVVRPSAAADILERSSRLAFCTTFAFWAFILACIIVLLALWGGTVTIYNLGPNAGGFTSKTNARTIAQVWQDWHLASDISPAELILLFVPLGTLAFATTLTWLLLPTESSTLSLASWLRNGLRRITAAGGIVISIIAIVVFLWVYNWLVGHQQNPVISIEVISHMASLATPLGCWFVIFTATLTLRIASSQTDKNHHLTEPQASACAVPRTTIITGAVNVADFSETTQSPLCEACGYDLSHQPNEGRCPECGTNVALSTIFGQRRNQCQWEQAHQPANWLKTTSAILFSPGRFYASLEMLTGREHAQSFSRGHYWLVGWAVLTWIVVEMSLGRLPGLQSLLVAAVFGLFLSLLGWITHRFVGALSATIWLFRGELPNPHVLPKAFYYETPFLWVFYAYNGLIVTSMINGNWLFKWIGITGMFNMPVELLAILVGNGLLIVIWLFRFGRVYRAVRWANF